MTRMWYTSIYVGQDTHKYKIKIPVKDITNNVDMFQTLINLYLVSVNIKVIYIIFNIAMKDQL